MNDWCEGTLGDVVAEMRNGVNCNQDKSGVGDKITRIETIADSTFNLERVGYSVLSAKDKEKHKLVGGDILFSHINSAVHVGKTALLDDDCEIYHGINLMLLRSRDFMSSQFLDYYLKMMFQSGYWRKICKQSVNQASVNQKDIKKVPIRYPPLTEQERIVAILDEASKGIGRAAANAEKNLANARELFESYLNAIFTQKGEGWVERKLGDLTERITKGSSPKWQGISYVDEPGVLFVTSENVGSNRMDYAKTKFVEESFNQKDRKSILKKGDVLTNIVGASIGRTAVFDRDGLANINQAVCLIRCDPAQLSSKYLSYVLNSPYFRRVLHENEINNARANLSLGFFRGLNLPIPPLTEQRIILSRLESYESESRNLESIYRQKLDDLTELKQSILQKAFAGELTTQPDQALKEAVA